MDLMLVYDSQWFAPAEIGVRQSTQLHQRRVLRSSAALTLLWDRSGALCT